MDSEVLVHLCQLFLLKQWEMIAFWRKYMGMWDRGGSQGDDPI